MGVRISVAFIPTISKHIKPGDVFKFVHVGYFFIYSRFMIASYHLLVVFLHMNCRLVIGMLSSIDCRLPGRGCVGFIP